eukprot:scaffold279_cov116-Isochrysis_galbana.AAC.4
MMTSPAAASVRTIASKMRLACASFRCWNRKLARTAERIRPSSASVLGNITGTNPAESSSDSAVVPMAIAARFSLDTPRLTGRLGASNGADAGSCNAAMQLAEPRADWASLLRSNSPTAVVRQSSSKSRKKSTMVMSSVRTSYCSHRRYASATTARQASKGSSNLRIMSVTVWLVRNSHTPSDASTMNLSSGVSSCRRPREVIRCGVRRTGRSRGRHARHLRVMSNP